MATHYAVKASKEEGQFSTVNNIVSDADGELQVTDWWDHRKGRRLQRPSKRKSDR